MQTRPHSSILPPPPPQARRKRSMMPWLIIGGTLMMGIIMLVAVVGAIGMFYLAEERIPSGVTVAGVDVGGKPIDDARTLLRQNSIMNRTITMTDGDRSWPLSMADLGVQVDLDTTIQRAKSAQKGAAVQPHYTIDLSKTQEALIDLSDVANIDAIPGDPPQIGRAIDIPGILNRLYQDVNGELSDGVLDLTMIELEPPELEPIEVYDGPLTTHVVERGQELALIAREYGVSMQAIVELNEIANADLIYPGQELHIPAAGVYQPGEADAPPAPLSTGKSIVVSTGDQRIYAYENGDLIRSHLVSTGRAETPTVLGDYKIYVKYVADDMQGPDYFLPQVPYTMYFHRGYGIHGTYWHNSFGRPMSHGCVNLPVEEANWFFNWAEVGTLVRVI